MTWCLNEPPNEAYTEPGVAKSSIAPRGRPEQNNYDTHLDSYRSARRTKALGAIKLAIRGHLEAHFSPAT